MSKVLIIGATSTIAEHVARRYATQGADLFLAGRNREKLETIADDLEVRGAGSTAVYTADLSDPAHHADLLAKATTALGQIDLALIAYGTLSDQGTCQTDATESLSQLQINFTSVVSLLTLIANELEKQGQGQIAVIGSVAGDRGRQSNYVYGAAKGGLSIYLQGLRNRFQQKDIPVLTIKPGFVDTVMTRDFKKGLLWAKPEKVAKDIQKAIVRKKDVLYTPWFWRWIMLIIKLIPERFFKKLKL